MAVNANEMDFFGDSGAAGLGPATTGVAPGEAADPYAAAKRALAADDAKTKDLITTRNPAGDLGAGFFADGGAYNNFSDSTKAAYNLNHDLGKNDFFTTPREMFNTMGEDAGVSHMGDAFGLGNTFSVTNPLEYNPLDAVLDPNKGLAMSGQKPVGAGIDPALRDAMTPGIGDIASGVVGGIGDLLGGGDSGPSFDTSGADRGGMGLGGAYSVQMDRAQGLGDSARQLGADVMSGAAMPGGAGAAAQGDALDRAMAFAPTAQQGAQGKVDAFASGPRAQQSTMKALDSFVKEKEGPSKAQLLLDQATQDSMGDALSLARSGRARDAGSAARALNVAQAENAATGVDAARSGGLLRAQEAQDFRNQKLAALGQKGDLAKSLDTGTLGALDIGAQLGQGRDQTALGALNLGGDLANQLRTGNIAERGQSLDFTQGQQQIGAGLESDVLKTIPALEQIRHEDQYELTPQQKLAAAKLGGAPDKTTADYVTGLLGDVLGAL